MSGSLCKTTPFKCFTIFTMVLIAVIGLTLHSYARLDNKIDKIMYIMINGNGDEPGKIQATHKEHSQTANIQVAAYQI